MSFLNRMLQILRDHVYSNFIVLPHQFYQDLNRFRVFLHQFNGVGLHLSQVSHVILLAFMEFLLQNAIANIAYYMAALQVSFILERLRTTFFTSANVKNTCVTSLIVV